MSKALDEAFEIVKEAGIEPLTDHQEKRIQELSKQMDDMERVIDLPLLLEAVEQNRMTPDSQEGVLSNQQGGALTL